jgi:hypothetical protein
LDKKVREKAEAETAKLLASRDNYVFWIKIFFTKKILWCLLAHTVKSHDLKWHQTSRYQKLTKCLFKTYFNCFLELFKTCTNI